MRIQVGRRRGVVIGGCLGGLVLGVVLRRLLLRQLRVRRADRHHQAVSAR